MAWVVDTCLILDVLEDDPAFGIGSAELIDRYAPKGLVVCPVTYIELSPAFGGDMGRQNFFLKEINVSFSESWTWQDSASAHAAWNRYVEAKRQGSIPRRPIADIQIGAFAQRFQGLLTRNPRDFKSIFPKLRIR